MTINADLFLTFLTLQDLCAWKGGSLQIIWYLSTKYQEASKKLQLGELKASLK